MSNCNSIRLSAAIALLFVTTAVSAQSQNDAVVAENSTAKITRTEFEAEIQRIPSDLRGDLLASNKRVGDLLAQMLLRKSLANQAKSEKLDAIPVNAARVTNEAERVLAQLRVMQVEEVASAAFDAKRAANVARAREIYLADRERYRVPEEISASHILFDTKKHSNEEARKLAADARARIVAGADFNVVAKELSQDPSARENGGSLGWFPREKMDAAFSRGAFALKQTGDISEPVQSSFGWHIIRLEGRHPSRIKPFDEVQDEIVASLRKTYVDQQRDIILNAIRNDPATAINDPEVKNLLDRLSAPPAAEQAAKRDAPTPAKASN